MFSSCFFETLWLGHEDLFHGCEHCWHMLFLCSSVFISIPSVVLKLSQFIWSPNSQSRRIFGQNQLLGIVESPSQWVWIFILFCLLTCWYLGLGYPLCDDLLYFPLVVPPRPTCCSRWGFVLLWHRFVPTYVSLCLFKILGYQCSIEWKIIVF
jgi:hypothetical protein